MEPELAELSRLIDPAELGRRIRNARLAAGLTQAELAGGDVTTAYVSRIEAGQRRPEFGLLERFAKRMGTSVAELLKSRPSDIPHQLLTMLDYAELTLRAGQSEEARAQASTILGRLAKLPGTTDEVRRAQYIHGCALEGEGRFEEAIHELESLARLEIRDTLWLRTLIGLSRCYREIGDFDTAIDVGTRWAAESEQSQLNGSTEAIQLSVTVAGAYSARGDIEKALSLCRAAAKLAEEHGSLIGKASAYWNSSIMESRRGAHDKALPLARGALALMEASDDIKSLGRLRTQLGILLLRIDPPALDEAKANLEQAQRELAWSDSNPVDLADNRLAYAKSLHLGGDLSGAEIVAREAFALATNRSPVVLAQARVLLGRIEADRGDVAAARTAYQAAILELSALGADRDAAQMWFELGGLLEEVGEASQALDCFKRGAASTGFSPSRSNARAGA